MKKFTIACAIVMASMSVKAQGFYLDLNAGYGFGMPGNILGTKMHTDIVDGVRYNSSSNLMGSIGNGLNLQLTPGYMITDNIGVELGINYFVGSKTIMAESEVTFTKANTDLDHAPFSSRKDIANSNQLRIAPAVLISTGASKQVSGYAKLGIIMPLLGSTTVNTDALSGKIVNDIIEQESIVAKTVISGAPSFGFKGALGINYNITDNLSVFGEVFAASLNVKQKSRKTTSYKIDGQEVIETLPKYSTGFDYVEELTPESNNEDAVISGSLTPDHDSDKPKQELFAKTSFSQMGFQFGIKYTFSKKKIRTISGTPDF